MIGKLKVHVLKVVRFVLLVEFFAQADQKIVILDWVSDCYQFLWDLAMVKQVSHFRPVILVLSAERI